MLLLILVAPCWSVVTVDVVEGSTASIPCDVIIQSTEADALLLVLFYRDEDYSKPIFTYDTRYPNGAIKNSIHQNKCHRVIPPSH